MFSLNFIKTYLVKPAEQKCIKIQQNSGQFTVLKMKTTIKFSERPCTGNGVVQRTNSRDSCSVPMCRDYCFVADYNSSRALHKPYYAILSEIIVNQKISQCCKNCLQSKIKNALHLLICQFN